LFSGKVVFGGKCFRESCFGEGVFGFQRLILSACDLSCVPITSLYRPINMCALTSASSGPVDQGTLTASLSEISQIFGGIVVRQLIY
jgi:hypothetical protein